MVNYEITKIQKLYEVNNDMAHNFYFIYYGKIINEKKTKFKRFKFVQWFDIFDVMEYFEKDFVSNENIKQYAEELSFVYELQNIKNYNDEKGLKEFYDFCNETIKNYNRIIKY